jgi:predicted nucleic-acid-binding protein
VIGIDTNILVRYLAADDQAQTDTVHRLLAGARAAGESVFISHIVLCETFWVLRSVFDKPKAEIVAALDALLNVDVLRVEEPDIVRRALESCRRGKGDFADYLIGQIHAARGCSSTATFDRTLRSAPGFTVL